MTPFAALCSLILVCSALGACALQPPAATALPPLPAQWDHAPPAAADPTGGVAEGAAHPQTDAWWTRLRDPAIDHLVAAAHADAPTLAQAAARVEQARASVGSAQAGAAPHLGGSLAGSRGTSNGSIPVVVENLATAALSASWEVDLFGRLRHSAAAAQDRLAARSADATLAELALTSQIADTVLLRRACALTLTRQQAALQSAQTTLALISRKQEAGLAAPLEVARSRTSVGEVRAAEIASRGQCAQYTQILADLSGTSASAVEAALAEPTALADTPLPVPPPMALALPATVLGGHPALVSALRSADAAFEEIGQARAGRLPSLNLAALLSTSRIQFGRVDQSVNGWSLGPTLGFTALDGGGGAAVVDAARGRYAESLALLQQSLRDTVRDVELALIQAGTAADAEQAASATLAAAEALFRASDAAQRAGRLSLFDLETARSAWLSAQSGLVAAQRDRARAWVALIKATGNPATPPLAAAATTRGAPP